MRCTGVGSSYRDRAPRMAVEAGTVKVIGVEEDRIYDEAVNLIENKVEYEKMARAVNPYGDGHASERIVAHLLEWKNRQL